MKAPTKKEFAELVSTAMAHHPGHHIDGPNGVVPKRQYRQDIAPLLAAFDALAAERDEWKRRAEALYGQCTEIAKCPTYYDGCHCTAATVQHNIERADKAGAERDAALELIGRYREAERNRRAKHEIRNVEDLCEALACGCLEEGPSPSVPCAGCQSIFDFVNAALARAAKAEEERDAALAKLHDWRFARWRELPEFDRKIATDLLNFAGHGEAKAKQHDAGARPFWWALDCLEAITDTLPPPKDPRIEAWRGLDAAEREITAVMLRGFGFGTRSSWPTEAGCEIAAAALEALGEGK